MRGKDKLGACGYHTHATMYKIDNQVLAVQCLRAHLPMQGTRTGTLVREDSTHRVATKSAPWLWSPCALEPEHRRQNSARLPWLEKSLPAAMKTPHSQQVKQNQILKNKIKIHSFFLKNNKDLPWSIGNYTKYCVI